MGQEYYDRLIAKCEELGWSAIEDEDGIVELQQYSPAGEDFSFEIKKERFVDDVWDFYNSFDIDDHIEEWVLARHNGDGSVPCVRALCNDAEAIDLMLCKLFYELDRVER